MAKYIKMNDGAHRITVTEARVDFMKEKGFAVEGDVNLGPGQLVGHIRVRKPAPPTPPDHVKNEVEMTDGFQVIKSDKNNSAAHEKFVRKGFVELPPLPLQPDFNGAESVEEIHKLAAKWGLIAAPALAQRERIKKEAARNGRYRKNS